jgi:hypothetical protein
MRTLAVLLLCLGVHASDDDWSKVKQTTTGADVRVFKKGSSKPVLAKLDEATDEKLLVVVKNEQVAIPREQIDRIDYRPPGGNKVTKETKVTQNDPPGSGTPQRGPTYGASVPSQQNVTTGVTVGGKPDFELLYRRPAGKPKP